MPFEIIAVLAVSIYILLCNPYGKTRSAVKDRDAQLEHLRLQEGGSTIGSLDVSGAVGRIWGKPVRGGVVTVYFSSNAHETGQSTRFIFRTFGLAALPRFEIFSSSITANIAKLFGMEDIEVGDQELDDAFILKAASPAWLKKFLVPQVRDALKHLRQRYPDRISLSAFGDTLELRVDRWLNGPDLTSFFHTGEMLLGELIPELARVEPALIEGTAAALETLPATAHCLVCGEVLAGRPVVNCRRCDTPHHTECWRYNGNCAVYGCAERNVRLGQR